MAIGKSALGPKAFAPKKEVLVAANRNRSVLNRRQLKKNTICSFQIHQLTFWEGAVRKGQREDVCA